MGTAGIFCMLPFICLLTIHESPDWLLSHNLWEEAISAMKYYDPGVSGKNENDKAYKVLVADAQNAAIEETNTSGNNER